jgi:NADPH2:quinone reductase
MQKTFKAYRIHQVEQEGKKTIQAAFENMSLDALTEGDTLIKVEYSSINYKDALAATGKGKILRRFPLNGGIDLAGEIISSENPSLSKGQKVLITGCGIGEEFDGGYAEIARVKNEWVIPIPEGLDTKKVMGLGTAGFTAALAITRMEHNGSSPAKGRIAVTGATGGVGSLAINMLAGLGYEVVAITGKAEQINYLKSLGASEVILRQDIDYGMRPMESVLFAGAIDNVGGEMLTWLTRTVDWWGNIASIGLAGSHELNTTVMPFILRGINLLGINSVATPRAMREKVWERLSSDLLPEKLDEIAYTVIEFDEIPNAFNAYIEGGVTGRRVVKIQ